MNTAFIGLGSNLSEPEQQIRLAVKAIGQLPEVNNRLVSALYFSRPMGPQDQPNYMNAVLKIETSLPALKLLDGLQSIENKAGRVRKDNRWGPRILDLDILLFNNEIIENERLTVPHYGLKEREFVLTPLVEIAPDLILPDGNSIKLLSSQVPNNGLKVYDHSLVDYLT